MTGIIEASEAARLLEASIRGELPDERGRFGPFGGRYVPETLVPAFERLEAGATEGADLVLQEAQALVAAPVGPPDLCSRLFEGVRRGFRHFLVGVSAEGLQDRAGIGVPDLAQQIREPGSTWEAQGLAALLSEAAVIRRMRDRMSHSRTGEHRDTVG